MDTKQPGYMIDPLDMIKSAWRQKFAFLSVLIIMIAFAVIYLNVATYRYAVTLIVRPVQGGNMNLSSSLGNLASVTGIALPGNDAQDRFRVYLQLLTARPTADKLARDQELMQAMFSSEWDRQSRQWKQPDSILRSFGRGIRRLLGLPVYPWRAPDGARVQQYLENALVVIETRDQPAVELKLLIHDPSAGRRLLEALHGNVDQLLKERARLRAAESITYLQKRLQSETVEDLRQSLIGWQLKEEQERMMTSSELPYATEALSEPTVSAFPATPRPAFTLLIALLLALLIAFPLCHWLDGRRTPIAAT